MKKAYTFWDEGIDSNRERNDDKEEEEERKKKMKIEIRKLLFKRFDYL